VRTTGVGYYVNYSPSLCDVGRAVRCNNLRMQDQRITGHGQMGQMNQIADYSPKRIDSSRTNWRIDLNCELECTSIFRRILVRSFLFIVLRFHITSSMCGEQVPNFVSTLRL